MTNQAYQLGLSRVGMDVTIWPLAKIVGPEVISVGNGVIIDDFVFLMGGKKIRLGDFVHIGSFSSVTGGGEYVMEAFSSLSSGVRIYTGNEDYLGGCMTNPTIPAPYRLPIRSFVHIKRHAIIGANTVILPGVTIGEGVAVGANSLIRHDCEPWMIYGGCPARILKLRPPEKIRKLERQLRKNVFDQEGRYIPQEKRRRNGEE